ncbi:MAG: PD40 domain-containing protein [Balneola sp.]|nr:PD40 domain-containing protein [Balneola sp.]MBO6651061.1 PD40 domain-containing protein [Balneola sp.]MBO6712811.1 PD40 domain-containing protein [Balneola sp.]MBO6871302.1 PD40 domain-containing protein [Balneola sp.]
MPFFVITNCNITGEKQNDGGGISLPSPVYPQAYSEPSVSPDGSKLLFVRNKITKIDKAGGFSIDSDSSGIWMSDSDGRNMKLLLQSQNLGTPSFSPDMKWILFEGGAQVYKMPFAEDSVKTDSLVQLTPEGRNFYPDWSPDGKWIVYGQSICNEVKECGIWLFNLNSKSEKNIAKFGNYPDWHPLMNNILYRTRAVLPSGQVIGDSLWTYSLSDSTTSFLAFIEGDNRYPKYSSDGKTILFQSNQEIWTMESTGDNLIQLTTGGGVQPTWTPVHKIIYVDYSYSRFSKDNGTLWMMNADGSGKRQLTFNYGLELE